MTTTKTIADVTITKNFHSYKIHDKATGQLLGTVTNMKRGWWNFTSLRLTDPQGTPLRGLRLGGDTRTQAINSLLADNASINR